MLVPLVDAILPARSTSAAKRIVIDPPEGLLELNAQAERSAGDDDVDIVTIFPAMVEAALAEGVVGRAREAGLVDVRVHDLRDFTTTGTGRSTTCRTAAGRGWC